VQVAVKVALFLVLLANSLTLSSRPILFEVYTVDLALVLFVPLVALCVLMRGVPAGLRLQAVDVAFALALLMMLISLIFSVAWRHSLTGAMDWLRIVSFYFACRLVTGSIVTEDTVSRLFLLMAVFLMALGLLQTITGLPIGLVANYVGENRGDFFWYRVSGPTPNSNLFAMWLTTYVGFVLADTLGRNRVALFFVILTSIVIVLIATQSRGGVLGFIVFMLALIWMNRARMASVQVALGTAGLTIVVVGLMILSMASDSTTPFADGIRSLAERQARVVDFSEGGERRELMEIGFALLTQPKVLLVGCGAYAMLDAAMSSGISLPPAQIDAALSAGEGYRTGVHNVWIATAVENGIPAAAVLLWIFLLFGIRTLYWRLSEPTSSVWTSYLLSIAAWYLLVASQVYLMAARVAVLVPLVLLISLVASRREGMAPTDTRESEARSDASW
jgi:O-antigen ligase